MGIFWEAVLVDVDVFVEGILISTTTKKSYPCFFFGGGCQKLFFVGAGVSTMTS